MTIPSNSPAPPARYYAAPPGELDPWTAHMVSMLQTLQSGASLTIYPGRIVWTTPDRTTLGFTNRQQRELHNIGV